MIKKVIIAVVALVAGAVGYAALQSGDYTISRELTMHASAEKIFPYLNNSRLANDWMPWAESDSGAKMNYSGPAEGVGSRSSWDSPGQMGTGSATVAESVANKTVVTKLEYQKPFQMEQTAEISIHPAATPGDVVVTWSVKGTSPFVAKIVCKLFMNMDKVIGGSFEKGLAKLKTIVEKT